MPTILCAGLITVDLLFEISGFPVKGTKNRAATSRLITGGGALNAAWAVTRLGGKAHLAGEIGDDVFGIFLREKFKQRGIDDCLVKMKPGATTSSSAIMISPDGDRTIINHRNYGWEQTKIDLPPDFPFDAALVDTRWPEAALQIINKAVLYGKPAIVDAEAPVAKAIRTLKNASHVIFSQQGLADFCGVNAGALNEAAHQLGGWCAVTRGALPVLFHDGRRLFEVPVSPVAAVNTLGAGDVWHAAFTFALAKERSEIEAVHWANAAASLKVMRPFKMEDPPTSAEVDEFIEATQAKRMF